MNWDAISAISETVAAVATILTLVYLAYQIRLNTQQISESAKASLLHSADQTVLIFSRYRHLISQPGLAEVYSKGLKSFEALEPAEKLQFCAILEEYFFAHWSLYDRLDQSALDLEGYDPKTLSNEFEHRGVIEWWESRKGIFPNEFVLLMENKFPHICN